MELSLKRITYTERSTIGELLVDGVRECFILEDVVREREGEPVTSWKVKGRTAIPRGRYRVVVSFSNRFQRETPELLNVPGFLGIRIHPGNTDADTEGCLLPGRAAGADHVAMSRAAYNALFGKILEAVLRGDPVHLTIT